MNPNPKSHINLTFNVREYIEAQNPESFVLFQETANAMGPSMTRLLKLMSNEYFTNCCLTDHLDTAVKVGEGGFGSICKITCPLSCSKLEASRRVFAKKSTELVSTGQSRDKRRSWLKCSCAHNCHSDPDFCSSNLGSGSVGTDSGGCSERKCTADDDEGHVYAVKRIPRERSVHDNNSLQSLFNEITCLEVLSQTKGVCQLLDYGTYAGEYWIVLELAGVNLSEWRRRMMEAGGLAPFKKTMSGLRDIDSDRLASAVETFSDENLSPRDAGLCLAMFMDILLIVKSVHNMDVAHFDIKCNNCVLKMSEDTDAKSRSKKVNLSPKFHTMRSAHSHGRPSGTILLIDFGESYPFISAQKTRQSVKEAVQKCRGTLAIQAPEIICISADGGNPIPSQVKFSPPSKKSDIWSLGCLLVELMSGKYLFGDRTWPDLFINLCKTKFTSKSIPNEILRDSLKNLPYMVQSGIEEIAMMALKQLPNERASIDDMIKKIDQLLEPRGYLASLHDNPMPTMAEYDAERDYYGLKVLAELAPVNVEVRRTDVILAERVIFQVLPTPFHPEFLITSPTVSPKLRVQTLAENNKSSLFNSKMCAPQRVNVIDTGNGVRVGSKEDNQRIFDGVDHSIISSDVQRAHRDATMRRVTTWMSLTRVVHIVFVLTRSDYELAMAEVRAQGLNDNVWPVLIEKDDPSNTLDTILELYTIANEAMFHGNKMIISVCAHSEVVDGLAASPKLRSLDPKLAPPNPLISSTIERVGNHSKLALSIGFALADALGTQDPSPEFKKGSMHSSVAEKARQALKAPSQPVSARIGFSQMVSGMSSKGPSGSNTPSHVSLRNPNSKRFTSSSKNKVVGEEMGKAKLARVFATPDRKDSAVCQSLARVAPALQRACCRRTIDVLYDLFEEVEEPVLFGAV
jgi:serine/threonine protein kinase